MCSIADDLDVLLVSTGMQTNICCVFGSESTLTKQQPVVMET